jgi:hypothetical protein
MFLQINYQDTTIFSADDMKYGAQHKIQLWEETDEVPVGSFGCMATDFFNDMRFSACLVCVPISPYQKNRPYQISSHLFDLLQIIWLPMDHFLFPSLIPTKILAAYGWHNPVPKNWLGSLGKARVGVIQTYP